jgi:hypothetical protein
MSKLTEAKRPSRVAASPEAPTPLYLQILSLPFLRILAGLSLASAVAFILLGVFDPLRFEDDLARFMLCLAVATFLAIFFFIFFPTKLEMKLPVQVGSSIRLVGPVALWFATLLFLWTSMPSPEYGRVFEIMSKGRPGGMYMGDSSTTYLTVDREKPPLHKLIGADDGTRNLFGIYVQFPRNRRSISAQLFHEGWADPLPVPLSRSGPAIIDVSGKGK